MTSPVSNRMSGLYGITDPALTPGEALLPACAAALRGGMRVLQYRDKGADAHTRRTRADQLRQLTRDANALLIINDDTELARACGADGVHLGQSDGDIGAARALLGESAIVGVTCHDSRHLAMVAAEQGADYVAFGAFFPTGTKTPKSRAEPEILAWWSELMETPCVAIGGITVENAPALVAAGADFLAVVAGVWEYGDGPAAAVRAFNEVIAESG